MTGACVGLESAETTLTNPCPCASEGACSDTENVGEVEAKCEASGVPGGDIMIHPNFSHPCWTPSLSPYPCLSDHYH